MMKAVRYHKYGDESVLRYEDAERPVPGPGQVLVQVAGVGFNPVDVAIRAGYLQGAFQIGLPHVPGLDLSGTVVELGPDVVGLHVAQPVVGFLPMDQHGAAAQYVLAAETLLTAAPTSVPLPVAAALPVAGLTASQALFEHADLQPGQRVLINGAGGAVGRIAVQLATQAGAVVLATAGPSSADAVRRHGADQVIDYTTSSVTGSVSEPVDVVLNLAPVGQPEQAALARLVRPGGTLVTTVPPGPGDDVPTGVTVSVLFLHPDTDGLRDLVDKVDAGDLVVEVSECLPLSQLADVHRRSAAGQLHGKTVLLPAS